LIYYSIVLKLEVRDESNNEANQKTYGEWEQDVDPTSLLSICLYEKEESPPPGTFETL
jgi:hypothetical protein